MVAYIQHVVEEMNGCFSFAAASAVYAYGNINFRLLGLSFHAPASQDRRRSLRCVGCVKESISLAPSSCENSQGSLLQAAQRTSLGFSYAILLQTSAVKLRGSGG